MNAVRARYIIKAGFLEVADAAGVSLAPAPNRLLMQGTACDSASANLPSSFLLPQAMLHGIYKYSNSGKHTDAGGGTCWAGSAPRARCLRARLVEAPAPLAQLSLALPLLARLAGGHPLYVRIIFLHPHHDLHRAPAQPAQQRHARSARHPALQRHLRGGCGGGCVDVQPGSAAQRAAHNKQSQRPLLAAAAAMRTAPSHPEPPPPKAVPACIE